MGSAAVGTSAKFILTTVDLHSRHVWATAVKRQTTEATISCLSNLFNSVATPEALLTDNGTNFTSRQFEKFLTDRGVKHLLTPPHRSQGNGVCERANGNILVGLRLAMADNPKLKWTSLLRKVVLELNERPHDVTKFPPLFLQFGLSSRTQEVSVEKAREMATERSHTDQEKRKEKSQEQGQESGFDVTDLVRYRLPDNHPERGSKLAVQWWAPCVVIEKLGKETFRLNQLDPMSNDVIRTFTAHSSRLAPYFRRGSVAQTQTQVKTIDQNTDTGNANNGEPQTSHFSPLIHQTNHLKIFENNSTHVSDVIHKTHGNPSTHFFRFRRQSLSPKNNPGGVRHLMPLP
jgi:hypothetical protein